MNEQKDISADAVAAPILSKAQILLQLAASCERESPSREIDCHIAFFVTGDLQVGVKGPLKAPLPYMLSEAVEHPRDLQLLANDDNIDMIPRYTTSLDAAVTLYKEKPQNIPSDPMKVCAEALRHAGTRGRGVNE